MPPSVGVSAMSGKGSNGVPLEPVQALILLAVVANLAVMAAVVVPALLGRPGVLPTGNANGDPVERRAAEFAALVGDRHDVLDPGGVPPGAYDRVVRIVSWVFILATSTIVAVTGLWRGAQPAILSLLAAAGLFLLVVSDLLPARAPGDLLPPRCGRTVRARRPRPPARRLPRRRQVRPRRQRGGDLRDAPRR